MVKDLLTAQIPSIMRLFQGLPGLGGTDLMVSPIRRMTVSASLSTFRGSAAVKSAVRASTRGAVTPLCLGVARRPLSQEMQGIPKDRSEQA